MEVGGNSFPYRTFSHSLTIQTGGKARNQNPYSTTERVTDGMLIPNEFIALTVRPANSVPKTTPMI